MTDQWWCSRGSTRMGSRSILMAMIMISGCYYSPDRYVQPCVFSNELLQVVRDDPSGSMWRFIQFGIHLRNLDSKVLNLRVQRVVLHTPSGSVDSALSPEQIWKAAAKPLAKFVATDVRTHDLVWHPSPAEAVTLSLQSVSIAPFATIDRVVVFRYPAGLSLPCDAKRAAGFTIEIVGTVGNGETTVQFPRLTWEASGFAPTIWKMPVPGNTR